MKFTEIFGRIFEMVFLFCMAAQYLFLWLYPSGDDAGKIFFFALLMGFEFIMCCAGVAFGAAAVERKWLVFAIFIVFFASFAAVFTAMAGTYNIMWIYIGLVISRLCCLFSDNNKRLLETNALSLVLYFFIVFLVVTQAKHVPPLGLNETFLGTINYQESVRVGGMFTDTPFMAMCVGVLYYGIQLLGMLIKTIVKMVR